MRVIEKTIQEFDKSNISRDNWQGMVSIANTPMYARYCENSSCHPFYLAAIEGEAIIGIWLILKYGDSFHAHDFPNVVINGEITMEKVFEEMILYLRNRYKGKRLRVADYTLARNANKDLLVKLNFENIVQYTAYKSELKDGEENLKDFHASHRNDARKALKEGYEYRLSIQASDYYKLSKETYDRSNLQGISLQGIEKIQTVFGKNALIAGVYCDSVLAAASIVLYFEDTGVYLAGASSNSPPRGATAYLQYMNMDYLRKMG